MPHLLKFPDVNRFKQKKKINEKNIYLVILNSHCMNLQVRYK